uniref:Stabilin 2 n=1 Tax=Pundamilia nyererei TaxID=303518 RepID=A0A3B4ESD6_9CICH
MYQPVTIFLPSDGVMASLPQEQKDFLFHQHNRPQLMEYLKYHILPIFNKLTASVRLSLEGNVSVFCVQEVQKCDLPTFSFAKNTGCRPICTFNMWEPKCCRGYYGRDCLGCPGGFRAPCNNRGKCDDGQLGNGTCTCDTGFRGTSCELCSDGFYGPTCKACNCSEHGSCDDGWKGTGLCFCEAGWTGDRLVDICQIWNGGCAKGAKCSQNGGKVSCTCPKDHTGDGFTCQPIDPCALGDNGGCHEHAVCTMTAPGRRKCMCKNNYIGDGVTCEVRQLPISRCLQNNGQCHRDAKCTDLHFEDSMLGVFHYRSKKGQYKLNYTAAEQACAAEGGRLATYTQLAYAQQGGLNMCAAGWLDQARVAYPTTYSNPKCGFGHVGIVDYGTRKNLSETWDTFCYRMQEVKCECKRGYTGDGFSCTGNLLQVLRSTPSFSNFLTQILNCSQASESGKQLVQRLSNLTVQSTLFVPDNSGLPSNQTLSLRDIEFHLSEGQAFPLSQLKNGSRIRTRVGSLTVLGVADQLDPSSFRYINDHFVSDSDIMAANGIIHVIQGPLKAPAPHPQMHVAHKAGMGIGVVLLIALLGGAIFVGYRFYRNNTKPFQFHYFKEDDGEEEAPPTNSSRNICNPVYEAAPAAGESSASVDDKHEVENAGSYDLLQIS